MGRHSKGDRKGRNYVKQHPLVSLENRRAEQKRRKLAKGLLTPGTPERREPYHVTPETTAGSDTASRVVHRGEGVGTDNGAARRTLYSPVGADPRDRHVAG